MISAWGGAVDKGETPLQAAMRETREEANLKPSRDDFEYFGEYPLVTMRLMVIMSISCGELASLSSESTRRKVICLYTQEIPNSKSF